ncbi:MAG: AfsR/SARP family transcriptional regulator, partial [Actinomycetota bacterium]
VSLAEVAEPSEVARAVADAVAARPTTGVALGDAIATKLARRPSLLVLDNCEHVVDGVADLVTNLSGRCPDLRVIATSREGLGVPAESIIAVGPLEPDGAATDLFVERARAADPDVHLDRATVVATCRRLDGVPLAIELAAARVRSIAPEDLLTRLSDSFRLLTGSRRKTLERHRTLHATMRWSYDLLSQDEQRLFRRLAVFSGPFDLRAAEQVVADDQLDTGEVGAVLADLVDRSMCLVESGTVGRRYRLLEPMRHFGLDQLTSAGEDDQLRRRHAHHVRVRAAEIRVDLAGPEEIAGAAALDELWPNLRSAVDWAVDQGDTDLALGLVEPIAAQGFLRRGLSELGDWTTRIVHCADRSDADTIGRCLFWTALYAQVTEDRSTFDRLATEVAPSKDLGTALGRLAQAAVDGDSEAVLAVIPAATDDAASRGDSILVRVLEILTIGNLMQAGRVDDAASQLDRTLSDTDRPTPPTLSTWLLYMQATLRTLRGEQPGTDDPFEKIASTALPPRTNSPAPALAARRASRAGDLGRAAAILRDHVDDLIDANAINGAIVVAVELVGMLTDHSRLADAAVILAALDGYDVDQITGMGSLLADARARVAADPTAARIIDASSTESGTNPDLLHVLSRVIDAILAN